MSKSISGSQDIVFSSFKGTDERSEGSNEFIEDGLNVAFDGGKIRKRNGRVRVLNTNVIRPTKIIWRSVTGTATDVTAACIDGDTSTAAISGPFTQASALLFIGFPFRVNGLKIFLSGPIVTGASLGVALFKRDSGGGQGQFVIFGGPIDGTALAGSTMQQTGSITWAASNLTTAWTSGGYTGDAPVDALLDQDLFWVQLSITAAKGGGGIAEIQGSFQGSDSYSLRTESTGMVEFVTRNGDRMLVASHDFPGRFSDDLLASSLTENRAVAYDFGRGDVVPLRIPREMRISGSPGSFVSYAVFNGWLIGSTTSGFLWKFNGTACDRLEFLAGLDAQTGVIGANAYLMQGPRGRFLEVYHSKLMVAGDPTAPLTFYASMEDNNISTIPQNATVGGPNVWPLKYVYTVPTKEGDYITGAVVVNDRYVVLTRSNIWTFDESSLRVSNTDFGCVSPGSVQKCGSLVIFLSELGVAAFDGLNASVISEPVRKTLEVVNWRAAEGAVSVHDRQNTEYWLWLPINGETKNSIAVVFNYTTKSWRTVSAWYPWDTNARRDSSSTMQSITAATQVRAPDGKRIIVTCDSTGTLYQENIGFDDAGSVFPAYALLRQVHIGEDYTGFRAWYMGLRPDGQWYEGLALSEGELVSQEIDRRYANVATNSEIVQKQALQQNCVGGATQNTFSAGAAWGDGQHVPRERKLKLSFARNLTRVRPALIWSLGQFSAGSYTNSVTGLGEISEIKIEAIPRRQAR